MIRNMLEQYRLAEARGHIPAGLAVKATMATVLEAGITAFHKAYYGAQEWNRALTESQAQKQGAEEAGRLQEAFLSDVTSVRKQLREAQVSTDFPLVLANIRQRVVRDSYNPVESAFWTPEVANFRDVPDFKLIKGYRVGTFNRLLKRAEGEDFKRVKMSASGDQYAIANYELGMDFTWEAWVNDDLSMFTIGLANLGVAARRNRGLVVLEAINTALPTPTTLTGGAAGPTITALELAVLELAQRTNADGLPLPYSLNHIAYGAKWVTTAKQTLNSTQLIGPNNAKQGNANPVFQIATPHEDPMIVEVLGSDWLGWDGRNKWLEIATLTGYKAGPQTRTKMPDVEETADEGSFDNHGLSVKMSDCVAALVTDDKPVVRVDGV